MSAKPYRPNRLKAKVAQLIKSSEVSLETLTTAFQSLSPIDRSRLGYAAHLIRIESL